MKWKFIAEFSDGSFIQQTDSDVSKYTEGKNAFYDVLNPLSSLVRFTLEEDGIEYGVNLQTLNFNTNGNEFRLHTITELPLLEPKIHYLRFSNAKQNIHFRIGENKELIETGVENLPVEFSHMELGWTAKNRKGEEVKRFIQFE